MIIEFNGLPGLGKTTVSRSIGSELVDSGIDVKFTYHDSYGLMRKICSYLFGGTLHLFFLLLKFSRVITPFDKNRKAFAWTIIKYFRMYQCYLKEQNSNSILIVDQGIIQGLLSFAFSDQIKSTKELHDIFDFLQKKKIQFISCELINNYKLANDRIKNRGTFEGRTDRIEEDKRIDLLRNQSKNLEIIRKVSRMYSNIDIVTIDPTVNADENAVCILKEVRENNYDKVD